MLFSCFIEDLLYRGLHLLIKVFVLFWRCTVEVINAKLSSVCLHSRTRTIVTTCSWWSLSSSARLKTHWTGKLLYYIISFCVCHKILEKTNMEKLIALYQILFYISPPPPILNMVGIIIHFVTVEDNGCQSDTVAFYISNTFLKRFLSQGLIKKWFNLEKIMTGKVSKAFVLLELLIFIIFTTPPFSFILLVTIFHQIYYDSQRYLAHFITLGLLSLIYRMKCINTSLKCWHWASFPAPVSLLHEYN